MKHLLTGFLLLSEFALWAQIPNSINPEIASIVASISEERITATLKTLEGFGTRNLLSSDTDPVHGIGAARRWIFREFQQASPRLQVQYDTYKVKKHGRVVRDVELNNVIARLPGTKHPEREIFVTAHYDSISIIRKAEAEKPPVDPSEYLPEEKEAEPPADWEKTADNLTAPGVTDDGSGVAVVLELARVLSQHEFEATLVFVAFSDGAPIE